MANTTNDTGAQLESATEGFDHLFVNEITEAREIFTKNDTAFHLMGQGVCAFLEAALSMETPLIAEATRILTISEATAKKQLKSSKSKSSSSFAPGTEWEVLHADVVVLLGLSHALDESYTGYLQCMYALNSAHSKFTKLYKSVFPNGLDDYSTPSATPAVSRKSSSSNLQSSASSTKTGLFGRWGGGNSSLAPPADTPIVPNGPVDDMIVAGAAFGYGLFNLVFSLLPKKIQSVVGFFGYNHDRKLAIRALAVSATKKDVHSTFAGLVLMTYYADVLLVSGYQADEAHIVKQYRGILNNVDSRYPTGALWILQKAKILRMTYDADGAIEVLQDGLKPERNHTFPQADTMLVFELAWTLLQQRRYQEAADQFIRVTKLNTWSHATYYFIAAGCYIALNNLEKAQELFDALPGLLQGKKMGGKDLPTEVLIKKKLEFYKLKAKRMGISEAEYIKAIQISPADEIGVFWNVHGRIPAETAKSYIEEWSAITPVVSVSEPTVPPAPSSSDQLDTPDELAIRSLLLGIAHRSAGSFISSRLFLTHSHSLQPSISTSTWVGGVAMFELAVTDLKEVEAGDKASSGDRKDVWDKALKEASKSLDVALALAGSAIDLSSRLNSRISMLKDEIAAKREMLGLGE